MSALDLEPDEWFAPSLARLEHEELFAAAWWLARTLGVGSQVDLAWRSRPEPPHWATYDVVDRHPETFLGATIDVLVMEGALLKRADYWTDGKGPNLDQVPI